MIPVYRHSCTDVNTVIASFHNSRYLMAPHIHQLAELIYVLEGELVVISPGKQETAKAGDIIISHPYQPHGYFTKKEKTVSFWMILFDVSLINDIARDGFSYTEYESRVFTPSEELKFFISNKMFDTNEKECKLNESEIRRLKATLYPIFDEYLSSVPIAKESEKACSASVTEVFNYLLKHFKENVTLKELSKAIGYSESHISHSLPKITGMNFRGVLNSIRVTHAKFLLMNPNSNISFVSVACGFGSERSFHRAFISTTGMTPGKYKEIYIQRALNKTNK